MEGQLPEKRRKKRRALANAEQQKAAVAVSESFVGRTMKVLVESEASAKDLNKANVHSWEHGLIRNNANASLPGNRKCLVARGEADAPDIDGRVYIRGKLPVSEFAKV